MDVSFEDIKNRAEGEGLDLQGVKDETGCGCACGMCVPYIKLVLKTGETVLPILDADTYKALASE